MNQNPRWRACWTNTVFTITAKPFASAVGQELMDQLFYFFTSIGTYNMDINHTAESQLEDEQLDDTLLPNTSDSSKRHADFQQHLADFEATADMNSQPIGRALTFVVADTLAITAMLGDAIKQAMPRTPATLDDVDRVKGP